MSALTLEDLQALCALHDMRIVRRPARDDGVVPYSIRPRCPRAVQWTVGIEPFDYDQVMRVINMLDGTRRHNNQLAAMRYPPGGLEKDIEDLLADLNKA